MDGKKGNNRQLLVILFTTLGIGLLLSQRENISKEVADRLSKYRSSGQEVDQPQPAEQGKSRDTGERSPEGPEEIPVDTISDKSDSSTVPSGKQVQEQAREKTRQTKAPERAEKPIRVDSTDASGLGRIDDSTDFVKPLVTSLKDVEARIDSLERNLVLSRSRFDEQGIVFIERDLKYLKGARDSLSRLAARAREVRIAEKMLDAALRGEDPEKVVRGQY